MLKLINKIRNSIISKIILSTLLSGIILNYVIFSMVLRKFQENNEFFVKNTRNYVEYLLNDIGPDPSRERLRELSQKYDIRIKIINGHMDFQEIIDNPNILRPRFRNIPKFDHPENSEQPKIILNSKDLIVINDKGKVQGIVYKYNKTYILGYRGRPPFDNRHAFFIKLIFYITAVIVGILLFFKHLLKPLKDLNTGIEKISAGQLEYEVPVYRNDELGKLTKSFNKMNKNIGSMIKSREQLLVDVSHELRTPLTRIKLALALMKESDFTDSISDDIHELGGMINEILESARLNNSEELNKTESKISKLVSTALEQMKIDDKLYNLQIKNDFAINADSKKIITVLKNIIQNALKYSDPDKSAIDIKTMIENGNTLIVQDYGIGISEKDIIDVFEPFYRADKSRKKSGSGFGLGLNIVKKIMDLHGFKIMIESSEGNGTKVILMFQ